jgi:hypothetical protein
MRSLALIVALAVIASFSFPASSSATHRRQHGIEATAARHCVKGAACGKICIPRGKVCPQASVKVGHPKGSSIVHAVSHY